MSIAPRFFHQGIAYLRQRLSTQSPSSHAQPLTTPEDHSTVNTQWVQYHNLIEVPAQYCLSYSGELHKGKPHGIGYCLIGYSFKHFGPDEDTSSSIYSPILKDLGPNQLERTYIGEFKNGLRHGYGFMQYISFHSHIKSFSSIYEYKEGLLDGYQIDVNKNEIIVTIYQAGEPCPESFILSEEMDKILNLRSSNGDLMPVPASFAVESFLQNVKRVEKESIKIADVFLEKENFLKYHSKKYRPEFFPKMTHETEAGGTKKETWPPEITQLVGEYLAPPYALDRKWEIKQSFLKRVTSSASDYMYSAVSSVSKYVPKFW